MELPEAEFVRLRLQGLEPLLDRCNGLSVLDVGCSWGYVSKAFHDRGARVCGFDSRKEAVLAAYNSGSGIFWQRNVNDFPGTDRTFDIVLALGILQKPGVHPECLPKIAGSARFWLAIRAPEIPQIEGFQAEWSHPGNEICSPLKIFKRIAG